MMNYKYTIKSNKDKEKDENVTFFLSIPETACSLVIL